MWHSHYLYNILLQCPSQLCGIPTNSTNFYCNVHHNYVAFPLPLQYFTAMSITTMWHSHYLYNILLQCPSQLCGIPTTSTIFYCNVHHNYVAFPLPLQYFTAMSITTMWHSHYLYNILLQCPSQLCGIPTTSTIFYCNVHHNYVAFPLPLQYFTAMSIITMWHSHYLYNILLQCPSQLCGIPTNSTNFYCNVHHNYVAFPLPLQYFTAMSITTMWHSH